MLEKTYDPGASEARIYDAWEKAEAFRAGRPERAHAEPYCIVIPPPNVTGSLHMGHALNNTLQDVLCRFERMRGKDVLWQPGTDHAGIATQLVVSRQLEERQVDWRKGGREKFLEEVWKWKAQSGGTIVNQLKRLGCSCDWTRERFTMDEGLSKAVLKVFVELANTPGPNGRNLIYRDKRLVNWDPEFQSAISDLEVEPREHKGSFKWSRDEKDKDGNPVPFNAAALKKVLDRDPNGHMYYIKYSLKDDPKQFVMVGTTRPETMLGDTGVAIHPENKKLKGLIGKTCVLPLVGREIPIVGDEYADPEKGTGAVKITPAHDKNDWEVGRRHPKQLMPPINIFDSKARIVSTPVDHVQWGPGKSADGTQTGQWLTEPTHFGEIPERYLGVDRFEARFMVVIDLIAAGVLEKIEPHAHAVPHAQRGDAVVEPWLTDQWYVDAATLAKPALAAVNAGKTRFVPEKYANDYKRWLENIEPWCISRQLWWGHQIPAWYGPNYPTDTTDFFVAESKEEAYAAARKKYVSDGTMTEEVWSDLMQSSSSTSGSLLTRDPDVLDTWFSSALWPFSTLGWPEKTKELARYYPTSCLVTGFDIIFFWVARMMMDGLHFMGEVPFRDVYIHGLVRDEKGRKMSKSIGNVIDPLELIDEYGADALRFTLAAMTTQGRDVKLTTSRVEGYRNFSTKLWNAARFCEMNGCQRVEGFDPKAVKTVLNRWIAGETARAAARVTEAIEGYRFNDAASAVYEFTWGVYCDWYLELAKPILGGADEAAKAETRATAAWALDQIMALLHPFMPFLTEELWAKTGEAGPKRQGFLMLSAWPTLDGLGDEAADAEIGGIIRLVSEVRSVRSEMNVPAGAKIPLVVAGAKKASQARLEGHLETVKRLARLETVAFEASAPKGAVQIVLEDFVAALPLAGVVDLKAEAERLKREIDKAEGDAKKIEAKLANAAFVAKAPPEVVEENRERLADGQNTVKKLEAALKRIAS